jgi:uncharacterized membrane protein YphA (DoxX/SURF4 family)
MTAQKKSALLWTAQVVLCLLFLFAGIMKLVLPVAVMQQGPIALPGWFLRSVGVLETAGALGLILPALFRIHRELTAFAAAGLVAIMTGAVVVTLQGGDVAPAALPFVVGIIAASIAYGRRGWTRLA